MIIKKREVLNQTSVYVVFVMLSMVLAGCSDKKVDGVNDMNITEIIFTDDNFEKETSEGIVLVDFWAPWCGPCKMQGPIIEEVAKTMKGKAKVGKCNVDEAPDSASRFGIRSIPTIIILKDGKEVDRSVGVSQERHLIKKLEGILIKE